MGYLVPGPGESWTPVTVLGTPVRGADGPMDLDDAERCLDETGLSLLADKWRLELPRYTEAITVKIVEVGPSALTVASIEFDSDVEYGTRFTLDVPVTAGLRRVT